MSVSLEEIRSAAEAIDGYIVNTPCCSSLTLSEITGAEVILKFENQQFTASFKERGALVKLLSLNEHQRKQGVIAMSAGNHAQGVAYHAQRLGIPATIVMPRYTPNVKVERTRAFGVEVILHGEGFDEACEFTQELAKQKDLLIHPYDDEDVIAGQGTIALEMLDDFPDLDVIVVPIGGGGLISGVATAAKRIRPDIEIIGVQAARFPSMFQTVRGRSIKCGTNTVAEGIAVKTPGNLTLPIIKELVDEILLVEESDIEEAVLLLLGVEKTVVEGAGAVGLAALLKNRDRFEERKIGLILSGGNIDLITLSSIIQRGLVRSGRLVRLRVEVPDVPGALADVSKILADENTNIVEVRHQRAFTSLSLQSAEVEFILHTLGTKHIQQILAVLIEHGYEVALLDEKAD